MKKFDITTKRLHLKPFVPEDSKGFQEVNSAAFIRRYLWDNKVINAITADEVMDQNTKHFEEDQFGLWKIHLKKSTRVMGYVGLWFFFDEPQPQLIYALLEPYTKKGYATEASSAIMKYAFDQLGFDYLVAATDEGNSASQKVAGRLGMVLTERRMEEDKPTLFFRGNKPICSGEGTLKKEKLPIAQAFWYR